MTDEQKKLACAVWTIIRLDALDLAGKPPLTQEQFCARGEARDFTDEFGGDDSELTRGILAPLRSWDEEE